MELALIVWIVCAIIAASLSADDKRVMGAVLGILFGPLGILIAVLMR